MRINRASTRSPSVPPAISPRIEDLHLALGNESPARHVRRLSWNHAGDRASGSEWLPPGTHRRRHRLAAELGADYLNRTWSPPSTASCLPARERDLRYDGRRRPPGVRGPKITKIVDGTAVTGWFVEDFTYAELRTLRARERMRPRCAPATRGRRVGDDPHLRRGGGAGPAGIAAARPADRRTAGDQYPAYFRRVGLPLEELLTERILTLGLRNDEIMVQSFEPTSLRRLSATRALVQLVDSESAPNDFLRTGDGRTFADLIEPAGLREVSTYAQVLAPHKDLVIHAGPTAHWANRRAWSTGSPVPASPSRSGPSAPSTASFRPTRTSPPNSPPSPGWASKASSPTTRTRPWQQSARPL